MYVLSNYDFIDQTNRLGLDYPPGRIKKKSVKDPKLTPHINFLREKRKLYVAEACDMPEALLKIINDYVGSVGFLITSDIKVKALIKEIRYRPTYFANVIQLSIKDSQLQCGCFDHIQEITKLVFYQQTFIGRNFNNFLVFFPNLKAISFEKDVDIETFLRYTPLSKKNISLSSPEMVYIGGIKVGRKHGKGLLIHHSRNGKKFQTVFDQNTYEFKNVLTAYCGDWSHDKKSGSGTYLYENGLSYEGDWKNDKEHGHGKVCDSKNKKVYRGIWDSGYLEMKF